MSRSFTVIFASRRHSYNTIELLISNLKTEEDYELISTEWLDTLSFGDEIKHSSKIEINIELLEISIQFQNLWKLENSIDFEGLIKSPNVKSYIKINEYDNKLWFNQEAFEVLIDTLQIVNLQHHTLESRLITADAQLAAAARSVGLEVWDCLKEPMPEID